MDVDSFDHFFQCPRCRGKLLRTEGKCSACHLRFSVAGNLFDFVTIETPAKRYKAQIELHNSLAPEYKKRYEPKFSKIFSRYWNKQFLRHLPQSPGMILDDGCGTGDLIKSLLPHAKFIIGSDVSRAMIDQARKAIAEEQREILWVISPGESLPFVDNLFDVICFRGSLHHMADEGAALKEAHRVLRHDGLVIISEPNDDSILLRLPRKIAKRRLARFGDHHKAFKSKAWLRQIEEIGFSIRHTKFFSFLSQPLCGMSDLTPFMKILPFQERVAEALISIDEICSKLPIIQKQSFDLFVVAQKRNL
jgi:ubiquinone/menaquinone biosynthesis C-methylase UbiE